MVGAGNPNDLLPGEDRYSIASVRHYVDVLAIRAHGDPYRTGKPFSISAGATGAALAHAAVRACKLGQAATLAAEPE